MDTTASSFTARNNAKRAAEKMIANGKAPAVNYGIRPRHDGRFEIVWKTAPTTGEVEAEIATAASAAEDGHYSTNPRLSVHEDPSDAPLDAGVEETATATGNEPAASSIPASGAPERDNKWPAGTQPVPNFRATVSRRSRRMTCRPPQHEGGKPNRDRHGHQPAAAGAPNSRPCDPVQCANCGSAPVLHPRSLSGFRSSVQREQILLVTRDQFRIAVAAGDLIVAHRSPIAGGGKLVQLVKALLVMRVRRRGHHRRLVGQFAGGDHRGIC